MTSDEASAIFAELQSLFPDAENRIGITRVEAWAASGMHELEWGIRVEDQDFHGTLPQALIMAHAFAAACLPARRGR